MRCWSPIRVARCSWPIQRAAELFGHPSPEALTGRSILALVALSDRERARVALRQMAAG